MSRILVTGGAGFIGSHIAEYYEKQGHEVAVIDDLSGGFVDNVPKGVVLYEGSIADTEFVQTVFENFKPEYVYHLAAYAAEGLSHFIRHFNYTNNLMGSVNLINESVKANVKNFIFTSSMGVYGTQQVPYKEDQTPQPEDPYGIAKYSVEQDLAVAHKMFDFPYTIIRPHNVYGERQNIGDQYRNVIGIFMNRIMQDMPVRVYGDGEQIRAFSYIGDIAPVMAEAMFKPEMNGHIFNVGGDTPYTINHLAETVMKVMGKEVPIQHLPPRYEVKNAYSDHGAIREHFELPQTPLEEGLKNMAEWAKAAGARKSKDMPIEVDKNLYAAWK